jgi:hypothetical protein
MKKFIIALPAVLALSAFGSIASAKPPTSVVSVYATTAVGSSNYDADPNEYSASRATGAPATDGGCADVADSWATLEENEVATLTLSFDRALFPTQVKIWANVDPHAVTKVETLSGSSWTTVFTRTVEDANVLGGDCSATPRVPMTLDSAAAVASGNSWPSKSVTQVRVTVDQSTLANWTGEIDAVQLVGTSGSAGSAIKQTSVATISGKDKVGQKLTANPGKYTGSPAPTYSYQWYACSKNVPNARVSVPSVCSKIEGATSSSLTLASAQVGKFISVSVTAANGVGANIVSFTKSGGKVVKK